MKKHFLKKYLRHSKYLAVLSILCLAGFAYIALFYRRAFKNSGLQWKCIISRMWESFIRNKSLVFPPRLFFLGISDPLWIPWKQTSDGDLQPFFGLCCLGLSIKSLNNWRYISVFFFCGVLKRLGFLGEIKSFNEALTYTEDSKLKAFACREIADIKHLYFLWHKQLSPAIQNNLFLVLEKEFGVPPVRYEASFTPVALDEVLAFYEAALHHDPDFGWIYLDIARLFKKANLHEKALGFYQKAVSCDIGVLADIYAGQLEAVVSGSDKKYKEAITEAYPSGKFRSSDAFRVSLYRIADLQGRTGEVQKVWDKAAVHISCRAVYKNQIMDNNKTIRFGPQFTGHFRNVRRLSEPFTLVDDKYLIKESSHFSEPFYKVFSPNLLEYSEEKALVYYDRLSSDRHSGNLSLYNENPVLFLGGSPRENYFHFIFEGLASLALAEKDSFYSGRSIVFWKKFLGFQEELLDLMGIKNDIFVTNAAWPTSFYKFADVLQLSCTADMDIPHPATIEFLRRRLVPREKGITKGKRVHLMRKKTRATLPEKKAVFYKLLADNGFDLVDPGEMTVKEQIDFFGDVEIFSAEGGAACSNLLFCPKGTKAIIAAPSTHVFHIWGAITSCLDQKLWMCLTDPYIDYPNPYFLWNNLVQDIDIESFKICIEEADNS